MAWKVGDRVFLVEKGPGEIVGFGRLEPGKGATLVDDANAPFVVVKTVAGTGFVPQGQQGTGLLRPLVSVDEANRLLTLMRSPDLSPLPDRSRAPEISRKVMATGNPEHQARFLKILYRRPDPSHEERVGVSIYEDLVVRELAIVLGLKFAELTQELRTVHRSKPESIGPAQAPERPVVTDMIIYHLGQPPSALRELIAELVKEGFALHFWPENAKQGPFPGLSVRVLKEGQVPPPDPHYLQSFGRGLDSALVKRLQASQGATLLTIWTRKGDTVAAVKSGQRFALKFAEATDGLLMDYQSREFFSRDAWRSARVESWNDEAPNASTQIAIHFYANQTGKHRSITVGMAKFGLPDLVVEDHPPSLADPVAELLKLASQGMLQSMKVDEKTIVLEGDKVKQPVLDAKRAVVKLLPGAKAALPLRPATRQKGDSDNVLELALGSPEQIVALHAQVFGSRRDEIHTTRQGDPELEEASRRARENLFAAKGAFSGAAERREIWMAKGLFRSGTSRDAEALWFEIRHWENGVVSGPLTSVPNDVSLKRGETVSMREGEIFDFMRRLPDGSVKGGETDAILKRRAGVQ